MIWIIIHGPYKAIYQFKLCIFEGFSQAHRTVLWSSHIYKPYLVCGRHAASLFNWIGWTELLSEILTTTPPPLKKKKPQNKFVNLIFKILIGVGEGGGCVIHKTSISISLISLNVLSVLWILSQLNSIYVERNVCCKQKRRGGVPP